MFVANVHNIRNLRYIGQTAVEIFLTVYVVSIYSIELEANYLDF